MGKAYKEMYCMAQFDIDNPEPAIRRLINCSTSDKLKSEGICKRTEK